MDATKLLTAVFFAVAFTALGFFVTLGSAKKIGDMWDWIFGDGGDDDANNACNKKTEAQNAKGAPKKETKKGE